MNRKLLESKMAMAGITAPALAAAVKMSYGAFRMKIQGQSRFNCPEAVAIGAVLKLTDGELLDIFLPERYKNEPEEEPHENI